MDVKKIGMMTGGFIGSFLVMVALMYFLYPYLNPEKEQELQAASQKTEESLFDPDKYGPEAVDSLNKKVMTLQQAVDSMKALEKDYLAQIDSLKDQPVTVPPKTSPVPEKDTEISAKKLEDVSKSLLNLDEDALTPIVNLLEDKQLVGLYNSASNMQRAKLLRSLKPDKAATILKKVM